MSHSLDKDIQAGSAAEQLLENAAFKTASASLKQAILDKWATSPIADIEGQHELRLMLKLYDDLLANLQVAVNNGKIALHNLKIERKLESKQ